MKEHTTTYSLAEGTEPETDTANLKKIQRTEGNIEWHHEIVTSKIQTMENTDRKGKDGEKLSIEKDLKEETNFKNEHN